MGGWAVNSQSLKCYLQAFAYVQALPPLSRDLLHERKISQAFLLTSFVLHGITWSTSRIGNVLHAVKVLHEIAQSNTANVEEALLARVFPVVWRHRTRVNVRHLKTTANVT